MKNTKICVVSYKRPYNSTCDMLMKTDFDWSVFVYTFDPYYNNYIENYGRHVKVVPFEKPNLADKRQFVLDSCLKDYENNHKTTRCIILDDDIQLINSINIYTKIQKVIDIKKMLMTLEKASMFNPKYIALSAAYNISNNHKRIEKYKNVCNNYIINLKQYEKVKHIKYNPNSKCEDMEFTMDLLLSNTLTGRVNSLLVSNVLQGGSTNDGLSYRFNNKNRFIEEGEYMANTYPEYKEVFEYDENHFKMNTEKLINIMRKKK